MMLLPSKIDAALNKGVPIVDEEHGELVGVDRFEKF